MKKDKEYDILYLTDYVDEFCVTAISKYEEATKLAKEIENDLGELKNKIEILKEKFDK